MVYAQLFSLLSVGFFGPAKVEAPRTLRDGPLAKSFAALVGWDIRGSTRLWVG